ncbi:hypothetical protein, partial [Glycomyces salinus]|uniref:hypothetical protein n=1 Tax=Glycomyces salinus TaxID=980294 RepID=UPI001E3141DA
GAAVRPRRPCALLLAMVYCSLKIAVLTAATTDEVQPRPWHLRHSSTPPLEIPLGLLNVAGHVTRRRFCTFDESGHHHCNLNAFRPA